MHTLTISQAPCLVVFPSKKHAQILVDEMVNVMKQAKSVEYIFI